MKELLNRLSKDGELCEVYLYNGSADAFCVCYVCSVGNEFVLFQSVAADGGDDGWTYQPVESIAAVRTGTRYLQNIKALMKNKSNEYRSPEYKDNGLDGLLSFIKRSGYICTVETDNDEDRNICGKIDKIYEQMLEIGIIDENGCEDGFAYVRKDEISGISINSSEEQKINLLYNSLKN